MSDTRGESNSETVGETVSQSGDEASGETGERVDVGDKQRGSGRVWERRWNCDKLNNRDSRCGSPDELCAKSV